MSHKDVPIGKNPPHEVYAIIENPKGGDPVKYEQDKESGLMIVDRFLHTAMYYPGNYGYIPHTLSDDGDPIDIIVISDIPIDRGAILPAIPIGVFIMEDDNGKDEKIIAVPPEEVSPQYKGIKSYKDLPEIDIEKIEHFFMHYKDLEKGKWVKGDGWRDAEEAKRLIEEAIERAIEHENKKTRCPLTNLNPFRRGPSE